MPNLIEKLSEEAQRIEEDTEYTAKSHFNAAARWARYHLWIGLPSAIIAAIAGGSAFRGYPTIAGSLAILSTALITVLTFLKPSERSENHKAVADQCLALRNQSRTFHQIELLECADLGKAKDQLMKLAQRRDALNRSAPAFSPKDYEQAKKEVDEGHTKYRIDGGGDDSK